MWLLEKLGEDRPYYFTCYLGRPTFSADVNDAVQFARQQDAELIGAELFDGQQTRAVLVGTDQDNDAPWNAVAGRHIGAALGAVELGGCYCGATKPSGALDCGGHGSKVATL